MKFIKTLFLFVLFSLIFIEGGRSQEKEGVLEPQKIKKMSDQELLDKAENYIKEMNRIVKVGFDLLKNARDEKDIQRINCINESLSVVKNLIRVSEQNAVNLQDRIVRGERSGAEHEFVKISIAFGKVEELEGEMKSCGGPTAEGIFEGKPVIEKIFDLDLPVEDPAIPIEEVPLVVGIPPSASPFY